MSYRREMRVARLAEVIADHSRCDEWGGPEWSCRDYDCDGSGNSYEDYAEHLANVIINEIPDGDI